MIELVVTGMTCGGCVASVRRAVERVLPHTETEVDLASGRLRINGTFADADRIRALATCAIEQAGFGVGP
jgi:copper chaperone